MRHSARCVGKRAHIAGTIGFISSNVQTQSRPASTSSTSSSALTPDAIYKFLSTQILDQSEYSEMLNKRSWLHDTYLLGYDLWTYLPENEKALVKEKLADIRKRKSQGDSSVETAGDISLEPLKPLVFLYGSCLAGTAFRHGDADFALTFPASSEIGEAITEASLEIRKRNGEIIVSEPKDSNTSPVKMESHGGYDKPLMITADGETLLDMASGSIFAATIFDKTSKQGVDPSSKDNVKPAFSEFDMTKKPVSITDIKYSQHSKFFAISRIIHPQILTTFYHFISQKAEESGIETDEDEIAKALKKKEKDLEAKADAIAQPKTKKKTAILAALEDEVVAKPTESEPLAAKPSANEKPKLFLHRIFRARVPIMQFAPPSIITKSEGQRNYMKNIVEEKKETVADPVSLSLDEDIFAPEANKSATPSESLIDRLLREDAAREKKSPEKKNANQRFAKRTTPYATGSALLDEALNDHVSSQAESNKDQLTASTVSSKSSSEALKEGAEKVELTTKTFSRFFKSREQAATAAETANQVARVISDGTKSSIAQRVASNNDGVPTSESTSNNKGQAGNKLSASSIPPLFGSQGLGDRGSDSYSLQRRDERHLASTPTQKQKKEHMDLSVALDGCRNSLLVREYMAAYPVAVRGATFLLKHWGRRQKILNARRGWLSPYALSIMFIHCLHEHNVIPSLVSTGIMVDKTLSSISDRHSTGDGNSTDQSNLDLVLPPFPKPTSDAAVMKEYQIIPDLMRLFFCYYGGIDDPAAVVAATSLSGNGGICTPAPKFDFDYGVVDIRPAPDRYVLRTDWDKALEACFGIDTSKVSITAAAAKARYGDVNITSVDRIEKLTTLTPVTESGKVTITSADIPPHLSHHPVEAIEVLLKAARRERWHRLGHEAMLIRDPYEDHSLGRSVEFFHAEAIREEFRNASGMRYGGLDDASEFLKSAIE